MSKKQGYKNSYLLKKFLPYYMKYKNILILDLLCAALTTACELVFPLIVRSVTSVATVSPSLITWCMILSVGVFYMALRLIDTAANYYMANSGHVMGTRMETDMRCDLFSHLQTLLYKHSFSLIQILFFLHYLFQDKNRF